MRKKLLKIISIISLFGSFHLLNAKSLENNKTNIVKLTQKSKKIETAKHIVTKYRLPLSLKVYGFKENTVNNNDITSFDVFLKNTEKPIGKIYVIKRAFLNKKDIDLILGNNKVLISQKGFVAGRILEKNFENKITSQVFNGLSKLSKDNNENPFKKFKDAIKIEKQKTSTKELITIALYEDKTENGFASLYITEFLTYKKNDSNCVKCDFTSNKDAKISQNSVTSDILVILKYNDRLF